MMEDEQEIITRILGVVEFLEESKSHLERSIESVACTLEVLKNFLDETDKEAGENE